MAEDRIPLSSMIQQLRRELEVAQKEGNGKDLRFEVGDIELELQLGVTDETKANGGIKVWVLNANLEGKAASQTVQKVKLKLTPKGAGGSENFAVDDHRLVD